MQNQDLMALIERVHAQRAQFLADVAAASDNGVTPVALRGRNSRLLHVLHTCTNEAGCLQLTTYDERGALGHAVITGLEQLPSALGGTEFELVPTAEADAWLMRCFSTQEVLL